MKALSSPKDFWAGFIYVAVGLAALWFGAEFRLGSAGRMGPGYFPKVLAVLLVGIGVLSLVRSFLAEGEPITTIAWKPLVAILAACALFGFALPRVGLPVALLLLCVGSAAASREFRFEGVATAGLTALIAFCSIVFVKGLGVPMPLLGSWLEPFFSDGFPWLK